VTLRVFSGSFVILLVIVFSSGLFGPEGSARLHFDQFTEAGFLMLGLVMRFLTVGLSNKDEGRIHCTLIVCARPSTATALFQTVYPTVRTLAKLLTG
jgi:hypothetical protein